MGSSYPDWELIDMEAFTRENVRLTVTEPDDLIQEQPLIPVCFCEVSLRRCQIC